MGKYKGLVVIKYVEEIREPRMEYHVGKSQNNDETVEVKVNADGSVEANFNGTLMGSYWKDEFHEANHARYRTIRDFFPLFINDALAFKPGEKWSYSNAGFMVLGAIIEKVSGQSYFA